MTGNVFAAGTNARVFMQIYGLEGKTELLRLANRSNNFERGTTEIFKVYFDYPNVYVYVFIINAVMCVFVCVLGGELRSSVMILTVAVHMYVKLMCVECRLCGEGAQMCVCVKVRALRSCVFERGAKGSLWIFNMSEMETFDSVEIDNTDSVSKRACVFV